jgi:hypothetical protein
MKAAASIYVRSRKSIPIVMTVNRLDPLPDRILDVLAELYWLERDNDPAVAALRA